VVINTAQNSVMSAATAKGIELRRHRGTGGKILADPNRLQQIVWNLITNAVKFTPRGGMVEVRMTLTEAGMELTVSDTGTGIAAEFLPHIFERFSQADATSRRVHGGLGIGLAIVKNLVEMHGGTVQAASEGLGKGSQFTMVLPLKAAQSPAVPAPVSAIESQDATEAESSEISLRGVRVLIVDDDHDARKVLTRLLADFEASVADAGSVEKAMVMIDVFKPHVLISDIGMPGQDGYDLVRKLRRRADEYSRTPAIALTAFSGPENQARAILEGFQVHLPKPVNAATLVASIGKLVERGEGGGVARGANGTAGG